MELQKGLIEYGLNEKEASIYLLCLEYGMIQPAKIASLTGIQRTTCYDVLDGLVRKGILAITKHQGTRKYSAISPELLFQQLENKCDAFAGLLPTLTALGAKWSTKPKITIYEGIEGIKKVYGDTLTSQGEILAFVGNQVAHEQLIERFSNEYLPARKQKNIWAKVILSTSEANKIYHQADKEHLRESRFLDDALLHFACEINCYGPNKIMIAGYSPTDMYGVVIESEHVYTTVSSIFTYIWNGLGV